MLLVLPSSLWAPVAGLQLFSTKTSWQPRPPFIFTFLSEVLQWVCNNLLYFLGYSILCINDGLFFWKFCYLSWIPLEIGLSDFHNVHVRCAATVSPNIMINHSIAKKHKHFSAKIKLCFCDKNPRSLILSFKKNVSIFRSVFLFDPLPFLTLE